MYKRYSGGGQKYVYNYEYTKQSLLLCYLFVIIFVIIIAHPCIYNIYGVIILKD